jgi:hypothetical protein
MSKATLTSRSREAIIHFVQWANSDEIAEQIIADSKLIVSANIHDFAAREIKNDIESELRDRFALAALPGISAAYWENISQKQKAAMAGFGHVADVLAKDFDQMAEAAYAAADSMMKARRK